MFKDVPARTKVTVPQTGRAGRKYPLFFPPEPAQSSRPRPWLPAPYPTLSLPLPGNEQSDAFRIRRGADADLGAGIFAGSHGFSSKGGSETGFVELQGD